MDKFLELSHDNLLVKPPFPSLGKITVISTKNLPFIKMWTMNMAYTFWMGITSIRSNSSIYLIQLFIDSYKGIIPLGIHMKFIHLVLIRTRFSLKFFGGKIWISYSVGRKMHP
jgi:hypothetical protein